MRVVAGELRGRLFEAPPGRDTRPTTDKVREATFNAFQASLSSFNLAAPPSPKSWFADGFLEGTTIASEKAEIPDPCTVAIPAILAQASSGS